VRKGWHVPGRQADRYYQSRVFPAGYVPGATDGSMPVGSGRVFMHFSSNYRTFVLPNSDLPPTTLFRNGLLITTLRTQTEWMALSTCFALFVLAQVPSVASIAQRIEPDT